MNELNWRYSIVITETQLDGHWNSESQKYDYPQTETTTYSNHLPDVLNTLLEHDIRQFEKRFAPTQESRKYLENAIMYDMEKDIVLLEVMNIDFDAALENNVPAGIYLRFTDVHESDFQELLGIDLSRVQHFGADEGWLRIAESTYNRGVDIAVDPGWQKIADESVLRDREGLNPESWKYKLTIIHQPFHEQEPASIFQYAYTDFNQATEAMQRIDLRSMDSFDAMDDNMPHLTTDIYLQNREGDILALLGKDGNIIQPDGSPIAANQQQAFIPAIDKPDHEQHGKYLLEITGEEVSRRSELGYGEATTQIKENHFFDTMQEAVAALMMRDIHLFEPSCEQAEKYDKSYEYASICEADNREVLLEIIRISIQDSLDGSPKAGIYMSFNDHGAEDFEKNYHYNFSDFKDYDPDFPFLLLAAYSYNRRLEVTPDPAWTDWNEKLCSPGSVGMPEKSGWKYQVSFKTSSLTDAHQQEITGYYFTDKKQAFHTLLQIDPDQMDPDIAAKKGLKEYIMEATLSQRGGTDLLQIIGVRDFQSPHIVPEPGIHLQFNVPIPAFEQETGIDLSGLGNYGEHDKYLLLAGYNRQLNELSPEPAFLQLQDGHSRHTNSTLPELQTPPYHLQVVWESVVKPGPETQQVIHTPYQTMETSFDALRQINSRTLDRVQAEKAGFKMYVKKAAIYREKDGAEIMSAFTSHAVDENLPNGLYIKINQDQLTLEALKVIRPHVKEVERASSVHYLIAGVMPTASESIQAPLQRKQFMHERTLQTPGSGQRKL